MTEKRYCHTTEREPGRECKVNTTKESTFLSWEKPRGPLPVSNPCRMEYGHRKGARGVFEVCVGAARRAMESRHSKDASAKVLDVLYVDPGSEYHVKRWFSQSERFRGNAGFKVFY